MYTHHDPQWIPHHPNYNPYIHTSIHPYIHTSIHPYNYTTIILTVSNNIL